LISSFALRSLGKLFVDSFQSARFAEAKEKMSSLFVCDIPLIDFVFLKPFWNYFNAQRITGSFWGAFITGHLTGNLGHFRGALKGTGIDLIIGTRGVN